MPPQLHPIGDRCITVNFGVSASLEVNRRANGFARHLRSLALPFVTDIVPTVLGVGVHYAPGRVEHAPAESPLAAVMARLQQVHDGWTYTPQAQTRLVEIPVCYGGEHGPDLAEVAQRAGLDEDEIVRQHSAQTGQVLMLGFAPGHPYLGEWGQAFRLPRRSTPRTQVAAGSVAVANGQTVIYPYALPGGWNLIGRTPLALFVPERSPPCLLEPGDGVRFVPITAGDFDALSANGGQRG